MFHSLIAESYACLLRSKCYLLPSNWVLDGTHMALAFQWWSAFYDSADTSFEVCIAMSFWITVTDAKEYPMHKCSKEKPS